MIVLGIFGAHHFYLKRPRWGLLYLFTFGLLGAGWLIDIFRLPVLVARFNNEASHPDPSLAKKKRLDDIYVLWFPGGLIVLLKRSNKGRTMLHSTHKHLDDAYLLWFPLGFLGFHHFYLDRRGWGLLYMYTFGFLGIGWLVDLCRMRTLVENCNRDIDERMHLTGNNIGIPNPSFNIGQYYVGGHVPLNYGQTGPSPPGYSNPHPGIYQTQQNGYGSVPGMNDQPPPYEAASVPTKGH
uniref:TM2 domain-containing protein n=1 Tax=Magallana gigas TaxID=29159 RepID=K1QNR0_MAGGI